MDKKVLEGLARQYKEYKRLQEAAKAELDAIADSIKAMVKAGEPVIVGEYKISLANVTQSRIDGDALKKALPEVAEKYSKDTSYQRLTIN